MRLNPLGGDSKLENPERVVRSRTKPVFCENGARQNGDSAGDIRFLPLRVNCLFMWGLFYSLGAYYVLLPYLLSHLHVPPFPFPLIVYYHVSPLPSPLICLHV